MCSFQRVSLSFAEMFRAVQLQRFQGARFSVLSSISSCILLIFAESADGPLLSVCVLFIVFSWLFMFFWELDDVSTFPWEWKRERGDFIVLPQDTRHRLFTMNEEEKGKTETSLFDILFKNIFPHCQWQGISGSTSPPLTFVHLFSKHALTPWFQQVKHLSLLSHLIF